MTQLKKCVIFPLMIPAFRADGFLPAGVHLAENWKEIESIFGGTKPRRALLQKLRRGLKNLRDAGCLCVLIDGSFVSSKAAPNDVDGCWEYNAQVDLTLIDLAFVRLNGADRAHLKTRYGMDFFIADVIEGSSGQPFSQFFQQDRAGVAKGIVRLDPNRL